LLSIVLSTVMNIKGFKIAVYPVQGKLYRLAKMMLNNAEEAEDTVQEALLKLWLNRHNLENYRSIEGLAMVITKNLCLDKLKSSRWHNRHFDELESQQSDLTPYQIAEQLNSRELILTLMEQLPEQQRMVIHLRDVEEYSFEEIEQITGLSINNVRVTLSRARRAVREMYSQANAYGNQGN